MRRPRGIASRAARGITLLALAASVAACVHRQRATPGARYAPGAFAGGGGPCETPCAPPCPPRRESHPPKPTPIPHLRNCPPGPIPHLRKCPPGPIPHLEQPAATPIPHLDTCPPGPIPHLEAEPSACPSYCDAYVPTVPINDSRSAFTILVMPPTPWQTTQGEADTPARGRLAFHVSRLSDERLLTDDDGNVWESDGEMQTASLEWVSPRICLRGSGSWQAPAHVSVSLTAYSLQYAVLDGLRNFVEENLLNADQAVLDSHTIGGRELSITDASPEKTHLLFAQPLWKAKVVGKVGLPDVRIGSGAIRSSFSVGVTPPAFGESTDSASDAFAVDAVLAFQVPIVHRLRLTGAASVTFPGSSPTYDDHGVGHVDAVGGAFGNLEWWVADRFAIALGMSWNQAYFEGTGLPMDLDSTYVNLGLMYRLTQGVEAHLLFSENTETQINTAPGSDFHDSQKDADFVLTFGMSFVL